MKDNKICKICGLEFGNETILKCHYSFVHPVKETENHDNYCSEKPISTAHTANLDQTKHKCSKCKFQTKHKVSLKRHNERIHEGIKNHQCLICDARYYERKLLNEHIQAIHEGNKFKCMLCSAEYNTTRNLYQLFWVKEMILENMCKLSFCLKWIS